MSRFGLLRLVVMVLIGSAVAATASSQLDRDAYTLPRAGGLGCQSQKCLDRSTGLQHRGGLPEPEQHVDQPARRHVPIRTTRVVPAGVTP